MKKRKNQYNLEERLIDFSSDIVALINQIPNNRPGNHLANQLIRSGTSVSLNYGEAQSAESRKDFIHKMKVILKELRETLICIRLLLRTKLYKDENTIFRLITEANELISIFVKSIETAQKNQK